MIQYKTATPEVLYSTDPVTRVGASDIDRLKSLAQATERKRMRLCAHPSENDSLHEMLIVIGRDNYLPPHRHPGKSEAFNVIEGALTVVLFHDDGRVRERIPMGPFGSGRSFYYRLSIPLFHTVVLESDFAVFHEVTNGPFRRGETEFASWAPGANAGAAEQSRFRDKIMTAETP